MEKWLDQSGEEHHLTQTTGSKQGKYEDGVMRYELDGTTSYGYAGTQAKATADRGLTTFSVIKIKNIPSGVGNFLFGDDNNYRYHAGSNGEMFTSNALLSDIEVNGEEKTYNGGTDDAEWMEGEDQLVYTRSDRDVQVEISRLSQDRTGSNARSLRGDISEVIIFEGELSEAQVLVINNYLGSKWGVDLGLKDYYEKDEGELSYRHELSGLVKLSGSEVLFTNNFGGVSLGNSVENGAIEDAGDGFFVGHNEGEGLDRRWYSDFTDASGGRMGGDVDISFSVSELGLDANMSYELVFGTSVYSDVEMRAGQLIFEGVGVGDGVFYLREAGSLSLTENVFEIEENSQLVGTLRSVGSVMFSTNDMRFTLNEMTGELSLAQAMDYEATLSTARELSLLVTLSEGLTSSTARVKIYLRDVDEPVVISENLLSSMLPIAENAVGVLGTVEALDPENNDLVYSVGDERFSIDSGTGELELVEGLNYEELSGGIFMLEVTVSDGLTEVMRMIEIRVSDVLESPVIEESLGNKRSLSEGETGKVVGTVIAEDPEGTGTLSYSLTDDKFSIDMANGELMVIGGGIDYEGARVMNGTVMVTVTVSDGTGSPESSQVFSIKVKDVNDAPMRGSFGEEATAVEEGMAGIVGTLTMLDEEGDGLSYSTNDDRFVIGEDGELSVLMNKVDYDDKSLFEGGTTIVIVTVSDGMNEVKERVEVSITDLDDNEFLGIELIGLVETVDEGTGYTEIGTIVLDDADGPGNDVTYILPHNIGDTPTYRVDEDGVISFSRDLLDNVESEIYSETITVKIGSTEYMVVINTMLYNTDDSGNPTIEVGQEFMVDEGLTGTRSLGMVQLTRAGGNPVYSVSDTTNFTINGSTGELSIKVVQDRESTESLIVTVTVSEAGTYANSEIVKVLINDVNEHNPVLPAISGVPTGNVAEYGTILVGSAMGSDGDADAELTYTIEGERFIVDEEGRISFISLNILDSTQEFTTEVTLSDGTTEVSQSLTITVGNDDGIASDHADAIVVDTADGDSVVDGHIRLTTGGDTLSILNQAVQQETYTVRAGRGGDSLTVKNMEINYVILGVTEAGDYSEEDFKNLVFANYVSFSELNGNTVSDLIVGDVINFEGTNVLNVYAYGDVKLSDLEFGSGGSGNPDNYRVYFDKELTIASSSFNNGLENMSVLEGDGESKLIISTDFELDGVELRGVREIEIKSGATLSLTEEFINSLITVGSAVSFTGSGSLIIPKTIDLSSVVGLISVGDSVTTLGALRGVFESGAIASSSDVLEFTNTGVANSQLKGIGDINGDGYDDFMIITKLIHNR